ncbi:hypothetical protein [Amycolatopsis sp. NPDC050768]|uniref:hypothetical protein n=1 Tax=Amycolatopsis sp. NPDC050768 TaxID=3154839 RepID=UPI0033CCADBF
MLTLTLTLLLAPRRVAGLLLTRPLLRLPALLELAALTLLTEQALPRLGLAPLALRLLPRCLLVLRLLVLGLPDSRLLTWPRPEPVGEVLPRLSRLPHLPGLPRLALLPRLTRLTRLSLRPRLRLLSLRRLLPRLSTSVTSRARLDRSVQSRNQFRSHVRLEPRPRRTPAGAG